MIDQLKRARRLVERNPSPAQAKAGNYAKAKFDWQGLRITLENPKGSTRRGYDADGNVTWERRMPFDYGYLNGTDGADGDQVDCFIGPALDSELVFVVNQLGKDGEFDEHKVMLGFNNERAAREAYQANYPKGWKVGPIESLPLQAFKKWLEGGKRRKPIEVEVVTKSMVPQLYLKSTKVVAPDSRDSSTQ